MTLHIFTLKPSNPSCQSAITWQANGGRFGDDLLSYARAKSIAIHYNIPLICPFFKYADKLMLYELETILTDECKKQFLYTKHIPIITQFKPTRNKKILYINHWQSKTIINWNNRAFIEELKRSIAPRYSIEKVTIPDDCVSIAVHIRTGGGFAADTQQEKDRCPLRFVAPDFYIEQVKRIALLFPEEKLYVHIFTDHQNPQELADLFKRALNDNRITFGYREYNRHNANVLEDFFSMMDFYCLIRPGSHYSRFVERLGNNKMVIFPSSAKQLSSKKKIIDTIKIKTRNHSNEKWKTETFRITPNLS